MATYPIGSKKGEVVGSGELGKYLTKKATTLRSKKIAYEKEIIGTMEEASYIIEEFKREVYRSPLEKRIKATYMMYIDEKLSTPGPKGEVEDWVHRVNAKHATFQYEVEEMRKEKQAKKDAFYQK